MPEIPFSKIYEIGAGMYKGEKVVKDIKGGEIIGEEDRSTPKTN